MNAREVAIPAGPATLSGNLSLPDGARGLVAFAHGSGSSRFSRRNRFVAGILQEAGLGTLLMDLLTAEEEEIDQQTARLRFDIPLLGERLTAAVDWLSEQPQTTGLRIGCFGASTGAAAALIAAAERAERVRAVVSRGGRPDLADTFLPRVLAPTLLLVGGDDPLVLELNRDALARLSGIRHLEIVPGATHLFEEPGALERVARLASDWFVRYLCG